MTLTQQPLISQWLTGAPVVKPVKTPIKTVSAQAVAANDSLSTVTKPHQPRQRVRLVLGQAICYVTPRQAEVIEHLPHRTLRDVALRLGVKPSSIKSYVNAIVVRLGCINRTDLVRHIQRYQLVQQCQRARR